MASPATDPRDLHSSAEQGHVLHTPPDHETGRWEREAEEHHAPAHEDPATRSSRIYFFMILAVIAAAIAVFLILRPQ